MIITKYVFRCIIQGIKLLAPAQSESPQDIIGAVLIAVGFTVCMISGYHQKKIDGNPLIVFRDIGIYAAAVFGVAILADLFRLLIKCTK